MLINDESIYLYNLTLKPPSYYISSIVGQFYKQDNSTKNAQQLVLVSSTTLQLFEINEETGKLELQSSQNLLGIINSIEKICLSEVDGVVITSDSGNLSILQYDNKTKKFISKIQEPMTKNGWGRNYVGENLAIDPENRCILVAAMEKNKLFYKIESNSLGSKELSSPLEAHSKQVLCLKIVALNTDHNNPLFGALELTPEKKCIINYYELDQGLNHVVKKKPNSSNLDPLPNDVNYLIPLPGHIGGMVVCGTNWCFYDKLDGPRIYLPLPRRNGQTQDSIIVNHVTHVLKKKKFFILLQNALGDLFKLTVDYDFDKEIIKNISITYFDTIPPALSLNIFKNGFLFANVLNNDKLLYQFEKLGDDLTEGELVINSSDYESLNSVRESVTSFKLKGLDNLALIDVLETLSPITDSKIIDSKLVTLSSHSYVKSITRGVPTTTLVESPLPITPTDIFTTKLSLESANDEYLVISSSLSSKTLVLSIGEVVEDVEDSEFVLDQPTIAVQQVGIASVVQIYSNGIKHVRTVNGNKKTTDWFPPAGITITHATTNNQQVLIALSNLSVVYFEIDATDDQLIEYQDRLEIATTITAMAIQENISEKSPFAIIGCSDETIQVVSLQEHNCLEIKSLQALSANSSSLKMLKLSGKETHVHIGMENGVYARIKIDTINGNLSNSRVKYIGSKPVSLSVIKFSSEIEGILAISSAPWISYLYRDSFKITPLLEIDITNGSSFISEDIGGEGIVGIKDNNLIIFSVGKEDSVFDPLQDLTIVTTKLRYTPRKMITNGNRLFISELEYNVQGPFKCNINGDVKENVDEDYYEAFGYEWKQNSWASCIQVVDSKSNQVIQSLQLDGNESIVSMSAVSFNKTSTPSVPASHLVVGVCTNQTILPNSYDKSYLYTFKIGKKHLQLVHKTELDHIPQVLENFQDKLLVASGNHIRLYDIGQKQLLKKSTTIIDFSTNINKIIPQTNRIIICDSHKSSIVFAKFDESQNQFVPFADDVMKRQITSIMNLDIDTLIGGDKFGNIFVTRIDEDISKQADDDWTILKTQDGILNSCPYKLQNLIEFHIGDIITSFNLGCLNLAGTESVIYTGLQGTIGLLIPLVSKSEVELLFNLQLYMQQSQNNLVGKDHLKLRSYYNSIKNVIDGDLLERFLEFDISLKIEISRKLNKSVNDIEKKLIDLRNRSAF